MTKPLSSHHILPSTFKPAPVFKNANLVRYINLDKSYPKETTNLVIENVSGEPQDEYFLPFTSSQMKTIGALEVRDKKNPDSPLFVVQAVEFDVDR